MKILKIVGIILFILIALPLTVALFVPRSYTVSVSETIHQPRQVVFEYVRYLNNQKDYSVWVMEDPNLKTAITGTDGTVGAIQHWNSKLENVGEGEQEITALSPERIDMDLRFKRPFEGNARVSTILGAISESQTMITSEFYSNDRYPLNLFSFLFGRKMIENAQEENLQNIKRILEVD